MLRDGPYRRVQTLGAGGVLVRRLGVVAMAPAGDGVDLDTDALDPPLALRAPVVDGRTVHAQHAAGDDAALVVEDGARENGIAARHDAGRVEEVTRVSLTSSRTM